jgi:acyl carrier protein
MTSPMPRDLMAELRSTDDARRTESLTAELQEAFARYLGVQPAMVDPDEPVALLGLDSLTAAQLALDIEDRLGVSVFLNELVGDETIAQLAETAGRELRGKIAPPGV